MAWFEELKLNGLKPQVIILEETDEEGWKAAELEWILYGKTHGWPLTNVAKMGQEHVDIEIFGHAYAVLSYTMRMEFRKLNQHQQQLVLSAVESAIQPFYSGTSYPGWWEELLKAADQAAKETIAKL